MSPLPAREWFAYISVRGSWEKMRSFKIRLLPLDNNASKYIPGIYIYIYIYVENPPLLRMIVKGIPALLDWPIY